MKAEKILNPKLSNINPLMSSKKQSSWYITLVVTPLY